MMRDGRGNLIVLAVVLIVTGLFLRWDLVDWLIQVVGTLFIAAGVVVGLVGVLRTFSSRKGSQASS